MQTLKAQKRTLTGRKVKKLRSQGIIPANIYGKGISSTSLEVKATDFEKIYKTVGETAILELLVDKSKNPVIIHNVHRHPVTGEKLHIDFRQVNLKEKITTTVPVTLTGVSPAEKSGLGILIQEVNEVDTTGFPTDFPDHIEVDISMLTKVDDRVEAKDLKFDKAKLELSMSDDQTVARIAAPQKAEEVSSDDEGTSEEEESAVEEEESATNEEEESQSTPKATE